MEEGGGGGGGGRGGGGSGGGGMKEAPLSPRKSLRSSLATKIKKEKRPPIDQPHDDSPKNLVRSSPPLSSLFILVD